MRIRLPDTLSVVPVGCRRPVARRSAGYRSIWRLSPIRKIPLGETDYGHIYFWDHEEGWGEAGSLEPDYSHCYFIASSFTELIDSLHPPS